jgi:hypothetical protein
MRMVTWILPSFHVGLLDARGEPVSGPLVVQLMGEDNALPE